MLNALRYGLSNYFNFSGRTERSTFWWYVFGVFVIVLIASLLDRMIFGGPVSEDMGSAYASQYATQPIAFIVALVFLIPNISMGVRRLHDIGKSGWWLLVGVVPIIGFFILLYFYVQPTAES